MNISQERELALDVLNVGYSIPSRQVIQLKFCFQKSIPVWRGAAYDLSSK